METANYYIIVGGETKGPYTIGYEFNYMCVP